MAAAYLAYAPFAHLAYNGFQASCSLWQNQKPEHTEKIYNIQQALSCLDIFVPLSHGIMLEHLLKGRAKKLSQHFDNNNFVTKFSGGWTLGIMLIATSIFIYDRYSKTSSEQLNSLVNSSESKPNIQLEWSTPATLRYIQGACIFKMGFELLFAWHSLQPAIFLANASLIILNLHYVSKLKFINGKALYKDAIQPKYDLEVEIKFMQPTVAKSAQKCLSEDAHLKSSVLRIQKFLCHLFDDATWKMNYVRRSRNGSQTFEGYEFNIQTKKPAVDDCLCKLKPILQTKKAYVLTDDRTAHFRGMPMSAKSNAYINFKHVK